MAAKPGLKPADKSTRRGVILDGRERRMRWANSKGQLTLLHEVTKLRFLFPGVRDTHIPWTPQQRESEHRVNPEAWPERTADQNRTTSVIWGPPLGEKTASQATDLANLITEFSCRNSDSNS